MASTSKTMPSMDKKTGSSSYESRAFHWFQESHKAISNHSATGIIKNDLVIKHEDDHIIINFYGDSPNKASEDAFKYITEQIEKKSEESEKSAESRTKSPTEKPTKKLNKGLWSYVQILALLSANVFIVSFLIGVWHYITPQSWWFLEGSALSTLHFVFFSSVAVTFPGLILSEKYLKE